MFSRALLLFVMAMTLTLSDLSSVVPGESVVADERRAAAHNDTSTPFNLVSMPQLVQHRYNGRGLVVRRTGSDPGVVHYAIRYRSAALRITGTMTAPAQQGRHPVVLLAHGYLPPAQYHSRRYARRARIFLARRGYVVVQPDYRNYGGSTQESDGFVARPRGYPEDLLNAVRALRRAGLPFVRRGPVNLFGRSMGGGAALQALAARPRLFRSAVLSSPLSSRAADTFHRWVEPGTPLFDRVVSGYGRPRDNPDFWHAASVRRWFRRVSVPVVIHHGTADDVCPIRWSRRTVRALREHGAGAELHVYRGQGHQFTGAAWTRMMAGAATVYDEASD